RTALRHPPLTRVQYSNVGYGLLAVAVERRTGQPFPAALRSLVLEPLRIEGYLGEQPPRPPALLEGVKGSHAGSSLEPFNSPFWRSLAMPWAGLVTTASGALALVRAFLEPPAGFLTPELAAEATRNQVGDLAGGFVPPLIWSRSPWGLGPELRDEKKPHWVPAPPVVSPDSFGHSGASGCIAWADPSSRVAWAILGTRTADGGWLLRRGPALAEAILRNAG
ncbi:MAG: serine hydrolase domain-containing protein, partial [Chloroflexota bacterium]